MFYVSFIKDPNLLHAYCDVKLDLPGAYQYKVEYTVDNATRITSDIGYVVAEPRINLPHANKSEKGELLPLDGLMVLSMVPKWMGPITEWKKLIEQVKYAGYNMIHFVPLQKRGDSNSPYSISDQLAFDDDVFNKKDRKKSNKEKLNIVRNAITKLNTEHGILSLSDVVWNHTSNSTEFLLKHPEAGNIIFKIKGREATRNKIIMMMIY
jgi:glycogen debranching enzyme